MGTFKQIAPNLFITNDSSFGNYMPDIVYNLLMTVDVNFSQCLEITPFSSCNCYIHHHDNKPMCCNIPPNHLIFLSVIENRWSQWIYQFAHEYCHHLINGKLSGEISGLIWFEETICELASMYHIHLFYTRWKSSTNPVKLHYAPAHLDYLNYLLTENLQLRTLAAHSGCIRSWDSLLSESQHHRDHYNAIAANMFPFFVANPNLWKIILHFGDMRKWNNLVELFEHLYQTADDSYLHSLPDLEKLLLS